MTRVVLIAFGLIAVVVSLGAYNVLRPPAEPTAPIQIAASPTSVVAAADAQVFELQPGESVATFIVDEVLRGSPKTVVGTTDQVAGQFVVDPSDPDAARVGTILINARTLTTDDTQRTRALQNQILQTGEHEYILFTPTSYAGLPSALQPGQTVTFSVVGDLTIRGVSRPTTFEVTLTPVSDDVLEGAARTTIRYADWGLSIPSVPFVASVADQVQLQLDFTANAA
jgi:polyisoprenoid-binding protein YceI